MKIFIQLNMNKKHIQLPTENSDLEPKDQLIYLSIKRFMNSKTRRAFPSLKTISEVSGASIPTIRKSIERLEQKEYIKIIKKGRGQEYEFNKYKEFEPFSEDFLDKKDLSFTTKAYLIASQKYMFKDVEGIGKISYTNKDLSNKINMSESSISRSNSELESKGYLTILNNKSFDLESGCNKTTKIYNLNKLCQGIIWVLKNHEDRINNIEEQANNNTKLINMLLEKISQLEKDKKIPEIII